MMLAIESEPLMKIRFPEICEHKANFDVNGIISFLVTCQMKNSPLGQGPFAMRKKFPPQKLRIESGRSQSSRIASLVHWRPL
jgi:hypothetical protein